MLISLKGANETSSSGEPSSCITISITNDFLTTEVSLNTATLLDKSEYAEEGEEFSSVKTNRRTYLCALAITTRSGVRNYHPTLIWCNSLKSTICEVELFTYTLSACKILPPIHIYYFSQRAIKYSF